MMMCWVGCLGYGFRLAFFVISVWLRLATTCQYNIDLLCACTVQMVSVFAL